MTRHERRAPPARRGERPTIYLGVAALRRLWRFRLRSWLVAAAAALGVAGFLSSVDYAAAGRRRALGQIRRLGTGTLTVGAQQSRAVAGRARTGAQVTTLVEQDYRSIRREVAGIVRASRRVNRGFRIKGGGFSKVAQVVGCEPDFFAIRAWGVGAGSLFDGDDVRRSRRVAVLGHTVARDLFGDPPEAAAIGQRLSINRVPFEVIGVLSERGPALDLEDEDGQVYVPLSAAMRRLLNIDYYNAILLEVRGGQGLERTGAEVAAVVRRRHARGGLLAKVPEDFTVQSPTALAAAQLAAASKLAFLVRWIGASALLVSGLGILAIAWIGVKARTVEIGTRRALGATAGQVFAQLLGEAGLLAAGGCLLGLAAGWAGTLLLVGLAGRGSLQAAVDWREAAIALASALALNLLFALLPSWRAARLDPIRALRHE
ncbi:MAG TPA: ABC transporter permease [Thermoanaerobaculia bacterium]|nr:ABC transporter permease [Thermoanaerobaculia bacterium]